MNVDSDYRYHFQEILSPEDIYTRLALPLSDVDRQNLLKMLVGWKIANRVRDGQTIGLGSGTTSEAAIRAIGERLHHKKSLQVAGIATSRKLAVLAGKLGIYVEDFDTTLNGIRTTPKGVQDVVWGFDGADEVEVIRNQEKIIGFRMIKGGGGAHTIERANAKRCQQWIGIVDESKIVPSLGAFPVAVEVIPNQEEHVRAALMSGFSPLNITRKPAFTTDLGNIILNVNMGQGRIKDEWETQWREISGVIDTGLFIHEVKPYEVLVAHADGSIESLQPQ